MSNNAIEAVYKENAAPAPLSTVESAVLHAKEFDRIKASLLDKARHINNISGKDRVNAAGWQTIAAALSVRIEIVSKNSQGTPGAFREVLEDHKGKKMVSFSVTVRATAGDRIQERMGRCDSTETKHNGYEHKMESVAITRAINRAVCAIVGGEPGDNADEAEDDVQHTRAQQTQERRQVPVDELVKLHVAAGKPDGSLGNWLIENIPRFDQKTKRLTPEQSLQASRMLIALC